MYTVLRNMQKKNNDQSPVVQNLTKLLANMILKFSVLKYSKYINSFLLKKVSYLHFCRKNINVFENTLATTVNEFVINDLVKLTML